MASSSKLVGGLPTTQIWDPSEIEKMDVNTPEFKRFLLSMHQNMNSMAMAVNEKASGTMGSQDAIVGKVDLGGVNTATTFPSGKSTFDLYRKVINFGPIDNTGGGIKIFRVPHNIPQYSYGTLVVISISGIANRIYDTAVSNYSILATPIPFIDAKNPAIFTDLRRVALWLEDAHIVMRLSGNGSNLWERGFNHVFVTVEYIYVPY